MSTATCEARQDARCQKTSPTASQDTEHQCTTCKVPKKTCRRSASHLVEEVDGQGVATVLAADAQLQVGPGGAPALDGNLDLHGHMRALGAGSVGCMKGAWMHSIGSPEDRPGYTRGGPG